MIGRLRALHARTPWMRAWRKLLEIHEVVYTIAGAVLTQNEAIRFVDSVAGDIREIRRRLGDMEDAQADLRLQATRPLGAVAAYGGQSPIMSWLRDGGPVEARFEEWRQVNRIDVDDTILAVAFATPDKGWVAYLDGDTGEHQWVPCTFVLPWPWPLPSTP